VIANFSPVPSAMTAAIAGQRKARSIAHARSSRVVASINIERSTKDLFDSSAPISAGAYPQQCRPTQIVDRRSVRVAR